jgi:hypothetical protein
MMADNTHFSELQTVAQLKSSKEKFSPRFMQVRFCPASSAPHSKVVDADLPALWSSVCLAAQGVGLDDFVKQKIPASFARPIATPSKRKSQVNWYVGLYLIAVVRMNKGIITILG